MLGSVHEYALVIREQHLDTFGHVNNAKYLEILEEARWDLITAQRIRPGRRCSAGGSAPPSSRST